VVVVTQSPSAATLLQRYVHGYQVAIVPDLERARHTARRLMPQAVVIDQLYALQPEELEDLGRAWGLPGTPFVVCPLPGEARLSRHLAVDAYLIKPVSRRSLWEVLRRFGEDTDRVLVVDDDRDFTILVSRLLADSPVRRYQVLGAESGREAIAMLDSYRPDLILLDLIMPDMDGFQVMERIRTHPAWRDIPIVVVSAQDEMDLHETLPGRMSIARAEGLKPSDVVNWIQSLLETAFTPLPGRPAPTRVRAL
jgi:CheY-like chemotaxis protein